MNGAGFGSCTCRWRSRVCWRGTTRILIDPHELSYSFQKAGLPSHLYPTFASSSFFTSGRMKRTGSASESTSDNAHRAREDLPCARQGGHR